MLGLWYGTKVCENRIPEDVEIRITNSSDNKNDIILIGVDSVDIAIQKYRGCILLNDRIDINVGGDLNPENQVLTLRVSKNRNWPETTECNYQLAR